MGGGCTAAKERQKAEEAGRRGIRNDLVKKIENQGGTHGNRVARKAEIERGREITKGGNAQRKGICFGKRQWRKIPSFLWYLL